MKKTLLFAFILALASALSAAPATTTSSMRVSAFKEEDGEEKLHLLMLDDSIPAGYRLA